VLRKDVVKGSKKKDKVEKRKDQNKARYPSSPVAKSMTGDCREIADPVIG